MKAFLLLLLFLMPIGVATAASSSSRPPNIIFILADDLGYHDLGVYGQKAVRTPHLDRLAAEGIRFTHAYAGASVCAPSRSVLMTGQHLGHTRVRGNAGMAGGIPDHNNARRVPLEPEDVTVAQVLKARGYLTAITGKWGLGEPSSSAVPNLKGFDEWFGFLNQNHAHTHYPDYLWRNQQKETIEANLNGQRRQHTHELFTDFAFDFIRRRSEQPFFLYLAYTLPHQEYAVPDLGAYADKPWPDNAKAYAAMVDWLDRDVGRLIALLKELKIDEHTIVFFCSDNGSWQAFEGTIDSGGALRGAKGSLYEGGLRTPMLVRWPGKVPAGRVSDLPWYFADVMPTLAELAGAATPQAVDGLSIVPTLLGKPQNPDRMLYWEQYARGSLQQAVRWGRWKGIRSEAPAATFELYDVVADPSETRDRAAEHREVVQRMSAFMESAHVPSTNWFRRPSP